MLTGPSQVEDAIIRAQNAIAGNGVDISQELISLEIASSEVPDLTLIDLPGITRVAVGNQPQDIGNQIINLIKKYINKQQTICLVVVPSNVDIATTEALKMAQEVDSAGERTLGILTKPDLVDKGTEAEVVDIIRNQRVFLNKGYMIVKCRGQRDINNKVTLAAAIQNERVFFEKHEHFRILLEEGRATIPVLAEKLTQELMEHINKSLPKLQNQIKCKLEKANIQLQECGPGVPETTEEQMLFLIDKIKQFNRSVSDAVQGEEVLRNNKTPRLFTAIRQLFSKWESEINRSALEVRDTMKEDVWGFENKYRGKELPGFVNYRTFEAIVKRQIMLLKWPATEMLKKAIDLVRETFIQIAKQHFSDFYFLFMNAQNNIEDLKVKQEEEAESMIDTQFKLERVVYCQDSIYSEDLKHVRTKPTIVQGFGAPKQFSIEEMTYHLNAYFRSSGIRLGTQIPLIIQSYVLQDYAEKLQNAMLKLLQMKDQYSILLREKNDADNRRSALKERISRLTKARERLVKFPI
ncbi:interferon-induced GTP-binding protein Mx1-like isoform X2 [Paroedura picta]